MKLYITNILIRACWCVTCMPGYRAYCITFCVYRIHLDVGVLERDIFKYLV